jgi:hypothetical protein
MDSTHRRPDQGHSPGAGAVKDRGRAHGLGSLHSGKLMDACSPGEGRVRGQGCLRPGRWTGAEEERPWVTGVRGSECDLDHS